MRLNIAIDCITLARERIMMCMNRKMSHGMSERLSLSLSLLLTSLLFLQNSQEYHIRYVHLVWAMYSKWTQSRIGFNLMPRI